MSNIKEKLKGKTDEKTLEKTVVTCSKHVNKNTIPREFTVNLTVLIWMTHLNVVGDLGLPCPYATMHVVTRNISYSFLFLA